MGKNIKKIDEEELSVVTGGLGNTNGCPYFLQATGMQYTEICDNCFFYNKDKDGNFNCTLKDSDK